MNREIVEVNLSQEERHTVMRRGIEIVRTLNSLYGKLFTRELLTVFEINNTLREYLTDIGANQIIAYKLEQENKHE